MEHDFILPAERETFIEQMKDVMDKAEDMLSEDTDVDRGSDTGASPPPLGTCSLAEGEVRAQVLGEGKWQEAMDRQASLTSQLFDSSRRGDSLQQMPPCTSRMVSLQPCHSRHLTQGSHSLCPVSVLQPEPPSYLPLGSAPSTPRATGA